MQWQKEKQSFGVGEVVGFLEVSFLLCHDSGKRHSPLTTTFYFIAPLRPICIQVYIHRSYIILYFFNEYQICGLPVMPVV